MRFNAIKRYITGIISTTAINSPCGTSDYLKKNISPPISALISTILVTEKNNNFFHF